MLCGKANIVTSMVRKLYDFLVTKFTLLLSPSTARGDVPWWRISVQFWSADEAGEDRHRRLGHRRVARYRLPCCQRQADLAQSMLKVEPLAALDQGLGQ